MAVQDYFESPVAYNPDADQLVAGASFQVFAGADEALSTPLTPLDAVSGTPIANLRSSSIGVLPAFRVAGDPAQVILKSGTFTTRVTSKYGIFLDVVPEPDVLTQAIDSAALAETAKVAAQEAAAAAQAVGATNDTIIAGRINAPGSATRTALAVAIDAELDSSPVIERQVAPALVKTSGSVALVAPHHLRRARMKLRAARERPFVITVAGNSVVMGAGADDTGATAAHEIYRQKGFVGQLRKAFASEYGAVGEGVCFPSGHGATTPYGYTLSGGATLSGTTPGGSIGAFGQAFGIPTTGHQVTMTTPACTIITLGFWQGGAGTTGTYSIDGGPDTPIPSAGSVETLGEVVLATGLSDAVHTVTLKGPSAALRPLWVGAYYNRSSGVRVHRIFRSGSVLADFAALGAAGPVWAASNAVRQLRSAFTPQATDLAVLGFSANNVTAGWTTYGYTPSQAKGYMQAVVDQLVADGIDVLLLAESFRNPASYSIGYSQAQYDEGLREIAEVTDHVAYLDVKTVLGSYADANSLGWFQDNVHPKFLGHADIAGLVRYAIAG